MLENFQLILAAEPELIDEGLRFKTLPPNYVAWLLIPLAAVLVGWLAYRRSPNLPTPVRILTSLLRAAAIYFVCILLFDPYRQFGRIEEIRSLITILVDESASMSRKEPYEEDVERTAAIAKAAKIDAADVKNQSRMDLVQKVLGKDGIKLVERAREKHDVKVLGYAAGKPRALGTIEEAVADGPVTATGDALAQVLADPDIQAKPNTSIVLISDGRTNTGTNEIDVARAAGANEKIPIHTIGVGDPNALRDLELRFVRADEVALKGNTVKMALTVRNHGYESQSITIDVADQTGQRWMPSQRRKIEKTDVDQVIDVEFVAERVGQFNLDVTIRGPSGEENVRNNAKRHPLLVKDERLRVLYVDTYPRWEYRRLKNYLVRGGESFAAQCLLLSAEPDFIQETTQIGDPSQRVPALKEFPQDFEALDKYDVLIFGDIDPQLLVPHPSKLEGTLKNIQKFVDNGGGLVVISGENWTPHVYGDSPLEELLPVDISNAGDVGFTANFIDEWKPKLTAQGRTHPIMQIENELEMNRRVWEEARFGLMDLRWWYPARKAMPSAQVLAYHPDQRNQYGNFPIVVIGTFGDGPVLYMGTDETWRWTFQVGPVWFNRFWGNVVRQMARAHLYRGSKRYKLVSSSSQYQQGESVKLTAFVKDKNFDNATMPTQRVMIVEPNTRGRPVEFEKVEPGVYAHTFKPTKFGTYEAWVVGEEGVSGEHYAPITFDVTFVDPERSNAAVDEAALQEIAKAAGGSYLRIEDADKIFDRLKADTLRKKRTNPVPIRRSPWIPLVLLGLLTTEWLVRKSYRMA